MQLIRNLQKAIDLANEVADERYRIWSDFIGPSGNLLPEYLARVREASLACLELSASPFVVATS